MIKIATYILLPNYKIKDLNKINQTKFISIKNDDVLIKHHLDYDYLNGAICIEYQNKNILGFRYWDLIDQLWFYFLNTLNYLKTHSSSEFYFPDQPIKVILQKKNSRLILTVDDDRINVDFIEFMQAFLSAALEFYNGLLKIFPKKQEDIYYNINFIDEIKNLYNIQSST